MITKRERCIIFIDGSNFYFKLKELGLQSLLDFNFHLFAKTLIGKNGTLVGATYYVGKVRTDGSIKTKKLQANQQKLLSHLRKGNFRYSLGYLMKTNGKYHEKGVDVAIAVDIVVAAYEKRCDRIILVSSDTDLLPAILKAKEEGLLVEYVGFSHQASVALVAQCSESRLLKKEDLESFLKEEKK